MNANYNIHEGRSALAVLSLALTLASCSAASDREESPGEQREALPLQSHINKCTSDRRVALGLIPLDVCVGAELFFREPFGGNGRTCGSCHPANNNFTIDAPFIATLPTSDPLFIAEQVPALAQLEIPNLMRDFGLILENVDNTTNPTVRFTMRSVPHCFSLQTSIVAQAIPNDGTTRPPNERTGWSGDGAPNSGELRDFQTGAVIQHYTKSLNRAPGVDFVLPTPAELDPIRAFMGTIGRTNELTLTSLVLSDAGAEAGRNTFLSPGARCNGCHNNAGANVAAAFNRNFDTGVERLRLPTLEGQGIPRDGGFGGGDQLVFNFDANGDGINDSFGNGTFNTPPLIEAADTAPFFHTNAFSTIEAAVGFYNTSTFANSPAGAPAINLNATEVANVGRFLRVLNTAFNVQLAIKRVNAVISIINADHNQSKTLQQGLAALALAEVQDAIATLSAVSSLNVSAQTALNAAQSSLVTASTNNSHTQRLNAAQSALTSLNTANTSLSTTPAALAFVMGPGSLMF